LTKFVSPAGNYFRIFDDEKASLEKLVAIELEKSTTYKMKKKFTKCLRHHIQVAHPDAYRKEETSEEILSRPEDEEQKFATTELTLPMELKVSI